VIFILSQRYGRPLPTYDNKSATHTEYAVALKHKKPYQFYIRDQLVADWTAWRNADAAAQFKPTWAKADQAKQLFEFISEHKKLADSNNWYWSFTTSFDLRKHIRQTIEPEAFQATAEKLVNAGQVPILIVQGQGLSASNNIYTFDFVLLNVGPIPAIAITPSLIFTELTLGGTNVDIPAVLPGDHRPMNQGARTAKFTLSYEHLCAYMAGANIAKGQKFQARLRLEYSTPSGYIMRDTSLAEFTMDNSNSVNPTTRLPLYQRKDIVGMRKPTN
jgi:hypothetical protein